jgi:cytochrome c oxidase cbb3-type subunit II
MNSGPVLFVGLLATMACSWTGFVLAPQLQLGGLSQTNTVAVGDAVPVTYPLAQAGDAHAGAEIYRANGCAACHTEMVRPRELGSDILRGSGARRSVAEDYLFLQPVMLGTQRIGPDLANFGQPADTNGVFLHRIFLHLYDPRSITPGSVMPPYRFLFEAHKIGLFPSREAIDLPDKDAPPPGYEIIPRPEGRALASYLVSLRQDGYLFEAPPPPSKTNSVSTNAVSTNAVSTNAAPTNAAPSAVKPTVK